MRRILTIRRGREVALFSKGDEPGPAGDRPLLKLHIDTPEPIEVLELTASLGSIARQYQRFLTGTTEKSGGDARLLVASVNQGSIDINMLPDLATAAGYILPIAEQIEHITKFGKSIKGLIDVFAPQKGKDKEKDTTVSDRVIIARDCDDAINILSPIANHGGTQTITIINAPGGLVVPIAEHTAPEARRAIEAAARMKARISYPQAETRQAVSMTWKRLGADKAKIEGKYSPDLAIIEEIDDKPKPVFFTDEMAYIKKEMISDDENPYKMVYFIDVEVSRIKGKVRNYRVVGFHGKEPLGDIEDVDIDNLDLNDVFREDP